MRGKHLLHASYQREELIASVNMRGKHLLHASYHREELIASVIRERRTYCKHYEKEELFASAYEREALIACII